MAVGPGWAIVLMLVAFLLPLG